MMRRVLYLAREINDKKKGYVDWSPEPLHLFRDTAQNPKLELGTITPAIVAPVRGFWMFRMSGTASWVEGNELTIRLRVRYGAGEEEAKTLLEHRIAKSGPFGSCSS